MNRVIPVIVCIDVEPDARAVDRDLRAPWRGYEGVHDYLARLRPDLTAATGSPAHFSWFLRMDPQIEEAYGSADWVVNSYPRLIDDSRTAGDEPGLHPHTFRWDRARGGWIIDCEDQPWVDHCVQTSFAAYEASLGRGCASIRFGDRWLNQRAVDLAEALGARFDLTIEPGAVGQRDWDPETPCRGEIPDYVEAWRSPYQPSRSDFRRPGDSDGRSIWMIPLSSATLETRWETWRRRLRLAHPHLGGRPPYRTLNPEGLWVRTFYRQIEQVIGGVARPYVAMVVRSSIALNPQELGKLGDVLRYLSSGRRAGRFVFSTPREALALLGPPPATGGKV